MVVIQSSAFLSFPSPSIYPCFFLPSSLSTLYFPYSYFTPINFKLKKFPYLLFISAIAGILKNFFSPLVVCEIMMRYRITYNACMSQPPPTTCFFLFPFPSPASGAAPKGWICWCVRFFFLGFCSLHDRGMLYIKLAASSIIAFFGEGGRGRQAGRVGKYVSTQHTQTHTRYVSGNLPCEPGNEPREIFF